MDLEVLLRGALPPIVAALALVSAFGARWLPVAMGGGLYTAYVLLKKQWPLLPHELWSDPSGEQWLLWAMLAVALVALLQHLKALPARAAAALGVGAAAFGVLLVLDKVRDAQQWAAADVWLFVGGGGLLAAATVWSQQRLLARAPQGLWPAVLWTLVLSIDAGVIVNGQSALLGQLCGAVAAALGAAVGTSLWRRGFTLRPADGMWLGAAHALFLLAAVHLAYLEWAPALIAMAAPQLAWLAPRRRGDDGPSRSWPLVAGPLVLAAMAAALWASVPAANPYGY